MDKVESMKKQIEMMQDAVDNLRYQINTNGYFNENEKTLILISIRSMDQAIKNLKEGINYCRIIKERV